MTSSRRSICDRNAGPLVPSYVGDVTVSVTDLPYAYASVHSLTKANVYYLKDQRRIYVLHADKQTE